MLRRKYVDFKDMSRQAVHRVISTRVGRMN
jgi:hypothetical protein